MTPATRHFPTDFLWGSATAAHQVEGGNRYNDWWVWEQAGRVREASGAACEHYRRYEGDFDLAASLHQTCHRFSIEWSRIEPSPGRWNDDALDHYRAVVRALRRRGLEPIVTLHHFTTPQWLSGRGSWSHPSVVDAFARYVQRVVDVLGSEVRWWITINEPMVLVYQAYMAGLWPPGMRSVRAAWQAMHHLYRAHVAAYQIIHQAEARRTDALARVSFALYQMIIAPCRPRSVGDRLAVAVRRYGLNELFLRAACGQAPLPSLLPTSWAQAGAAVDYLALNYYMREFVHGEWWPQMNPIGAVCTPDHHPEAGERSSMGWEIYPEGLGLLLLALKDYGLPIVITENGMATVDDRQRRRFVQKHLSVLHRAREAGVPVVGYCYWSLLDNFEWDRGFAQRFGLIEVDYATQARCVRESARFLAEICRTGVLPAADT